MKRFFLTAFAALCAVQATAQVKDYFILQGISYATRGSYTRACSVFDEGMRLYPRDEELPQLKAQTIISRANKTGMDTMLLDTASQLLRKAIALNPYNMETKKQLANVYVALKKWEQVIPVAMEVGENAADTALRIRSYIQAADAWVELNRLDEQDKAIQAALQLDYMTIDIIDYVGCTHLRREEFDKAKEWYEKFPMIFGNHPAALNNYGYALARTGEHALALKMLDKVIYEYPSHAFAWNNRARAKYEMGDYEGAWSDVHKSIELEPDNAIAWKNKALILLAVKQKEKACEALEQAAKCEMYKLDNEGKTLRKKHCGI